MRKTKLSNEKYYIEYEILQIDDKFNEDYSFDFKYGDKEEFTRTAFIITSINKTGVSHRLLIFNEASIVDEKRVILYENYIIVLLYFGELLKINLDNGEVYQKIELDSLGTYHNLYEVNNKIIVQGELMVYCIDYDLNIINDFSPADIIVDFKIENNKIIIKDFNDIIYVLRLDLS